MERADFVVLDFVMQPHPDGFAVAKGRKIDKRYVKWEALYERVQDKVRAMLQDVAGAGTKVRTKVNMKCDMVGCVDNTHSYMASLLISEPHSTHILRIEDFLRSKVDKNAQGDIPEDAQPNITVKVKDHQGRFVNVQVTDFTLSGPTTGDWKPFTQWYGALKLLGLTGTQENA